MNSGFRPGLFCRQMKQKTEDDGQEIIGNTSHVQQDNNMTKGSEMNMMMVSPTPTSSSSCNLPVVSDHLHSLSPQTTSVIHHHENQEDQLLINFEGYSQPLLQDLKSLMMMTSSSEENKKKDGKRDHHHHHQETIMTNNEIPPVDFFMSLPENERRSRFFKQDFLRQGLILLSSLERETKDSLILKALCIIDQNKRMDLTGTNILLTLFFESTKNRKKLNEILEGIHDSLDTIQVIVKSFDSQEVIVVDFFEEHEDSNQEILVPEYFANLMSTTNDKQKTSVIDLLSCLKSFSNNFNNPSSCDFLKDQLLLSSDDNLTLFKGKLHDHPDQESTILLKNHLRKKQKQKWSSVSLKEGIIKMKNHNFTEALQLFNKSLSIDKEYNADALVARACLKANNHQLEAALLDFEAALIIEPSHVNGKEYLSKTLMAVGDHQKKHKDLDFTIKMYQKAIQVDESNKDAKQGLQMLLDEKRRRREEFGQGSSSSSSSRSSFHHHWSTSSSSSSSSSSRRRRSSPDVDQRRGKRTRSRSRSFSPILESKTKEAEEAVETLTSNLLFLPSSSERNKSLRSSYESSSSASFHHHQRSGREGYSNRRDNDYHRHDHHHRSYNRDSHEEEDSLSNRRRYNNNFREGFNRRGRQELPKEAINRMDEEDKRQLEKIHQQMNF